MTQRDISSLVPALRVGDGLSEASRACQIPSSLVMMLAQDLSLVTRGRPMEIFPPLQCILLRESPPLKVGRNGPGPPRTSRFEVDVARSDMRDGNSHWGRFAGPTHAVGL